MQPLRRTSAILAIVSVFAVVVALRGTGPAAGPFGSMTIVEVAHADTKPIPGAVATPTPTPTPTPTATPSPTPTPTPTADPADALRKPSKATPPPAPSLTPLPTATPR